MKSLCTIHIIYFFFVLSGHSQTHHIPQNQHKFNYLTIDHGLSNNRVNAICQDSRGYMWFATQDGVNKYDGQTFTIYKYNINDSTSISSNVVFKIFLDSKNNLWFAGDGGLDMYSPELDNFIRFKHKDINWPLQEIRDIAEDQDGKIWFCGESGLYNYSLQTGELNYFSNKVGNPHQIPPNNLFELMIDQTNNVWISISWEGIYVFNQSNLTYRIYKSDPNNPNSLSGNNIEYFYEDKKGNIWIGTYNNGLNIYYPRTDSFKRIIPDENNSYSTRVRVIFEDLEGNLFIGTRAGLYMYNETTDDFYLYADERHEFSKLSQNSVLASLIDKAGTLWIGTHSGGVNYTNLHKKKFIHYAPGKLDNRYLNGSNIYAITEDTQGNLWIGGDNGLNYLDRNTHTIQYFENDPNNIHSLSYNDVKDLEWGSKGNLWIATNKGGLNYYDLKTRKFTAYKHNPNDPNSIRADKVYCLMRDRNNNLWIQLTTRSDVAYTNIDILPFGSNEFIHLNEKFYFGIDQDENGDIYLGGVNGFWIFSQKDSVFSFLSNEKQIGFVNTILKDSQKSIWIGSDKGLVKYDMDSGTFQSFSRETGFPIGEVYGILEDDFQKLWISTVAGLFRFNNIFSDTSNVELQIYDKYDGLQSKQFNFNAFHKSKSGEMFFGGVNGINTFYPSDIVENKTPVNVVFTNLKVFDTAVPIGKKVDGRVILEKSISETEEITLWPKHSKFSIEFSSMQIFNHDEYIYKSKLEGLDKDWQYRKANRNFVTYTNLKPGHYNLLISAANNDGFWNDTPRELKINVLPPLWKTWWFLVILICSTIVIIVAIYLYRVRSIRNQNIVLEKTVKKRTQEATLRNQMLQEAIELLEEKQEEISTQNEEIKSQNEELEKHRKNLADLVNEKTQHLEIALQKAKESDALKSAFLANMSHEIRTPMNAIVGFSSFLNEPEFDAKENAEFIEQIQANATSLLKIIDEIIDLSLLETNQLSIEKQTFEFNIIFDHIYSYYALSNNNPNIKIRRNNTLEKLNIKLNSDGVRLKQVVNNLLDNAIKFTVQGFIELGAYIEDSIFCIYVQDTGKGISPENIKSIFNQFVKIEDETSEWKRGLGLGLAISNDIAHALGGEIQVKSELGKGSTFTLRIPENELLTNKKIETIQQGQSFSHRWPGKIILIAEDVEANYFYLKKILEKADVDILWAKNGKEAIEMVNKNTIDLILMDIKMPVLNGYDAAKQIKLNKPGIKIIAQTAYARPSEKQKFYDENFDEYISKPIKLSTLTNLLERFLH